MTTQQWRDFAKYDCEGVCRRVEKAFSKYPVSLMFRSRQWMAFCDYLTQTYGSQLPQGYVFRLPTEAEWEYAFTGGEGFSRMKRNPLLGSASGAGAGRFMDIVRKLQKKEKWIKDLDWTDGNNESRIANGMIYIGGWSAHHDWGFCDLSTWSRHLLLDTIAVQEEGWDANARERLLYEDREVDPLRWAGADGKVRHLYRNANANRGLHVDEMAYAHIVIGPDLVKEKTQGANGVGRKGAEEHEMPEVADKDIPKPITLELRKDNVIEFMGCPKGSFVMGQKLEGEQAKNRAYRQHRVTITRPYWLSKFKVTQRQWNVYKRSPMTEYDKVMGGLDVPFHRDTSYQAAIDYCDFLTKRFRAKLPKGYVIRLPTEAEWEYALRVRDTMPESKYAGWRENSALIAVQRKDVLLLADKAGFDLSGYKSFEYAPIAVGTKQPNGLGLFDMIGNGFEMMLDTISDNGTIKTYRPLGESVDQTALTYADCEVDPLKVDKFGLVVVRGAEYNNMEGDPWCKRVADSTRAMESNIQSLCIRLCIGPDLTKENGAGKKAKKAAK